MSRYVIIHLLNFIFHFIFIFNFTSVLAENYRIVETKYGKIRGIRNETLFQKIGFYSFRGIPYAKAPIGELRFKVCATSFAWEYFQISNRIEYMCLCIYFKRHLNQLNHGGQTF